MKTFKILFSFILLASTMSCGKNEPEEKEEIETNYTQTSNITSDAAVTNEENAETKSRTEIENTETEQTDTEIDSDSDSGLAAAIQRQIPNSKTSENENTQNNGINLEQIIVTTAPSDKNAEVVINSPLRNLLRNAQIGKTYSKRELISQYKFPKEAVDLIKQVTCVGPNKLYFNWGSTWLVEKVSDAEFENDTMIFTFKKNKTYVSGGAIGIKYNKKIYTELILNNGSAYIPTVKGYHWEINK
jgi:hypothetical protein